MLAHLQVDQDSFVESVPHIAHHRWRCLGTKRLNAERLVIEGPVGAADFPQPQAAGDRQPQLLLPPVLDAQTPIARDDAGAHGGASQRLRLVQLSFIRRDR